MNPEMLDLAKGPLEDLSEARLLSIETELKIYKLAIKSTIFKLHQSLGK